MNLPPLPVLPALPPLPALAPLPPLVVASAIEQDPYLAGITAKLETLPLPFEPEFKRSAWFPLSTSPTRAGNYELRTDEGVIPTFYLWDGREWADKLPDASTDWRGWDRSRWVNTKDEHPKRSGWYPMRWPKNDNKAQSFYEHPEAAHGDMRDGWYYAHPQTGELLPYRHNGIKWEAEWLDDGSEL